MVVKNSRFGTSKYKPVAALNCVVGVACLTLTACNGRPALLPNYDPALRKTAAQFSADAAKRQPFKTDAPRGGDALGRGMVDYTFHQVEILNYSDEDWNDVEIWINRQYVCYVPKIEKGKQRTKLMNFQMFFDGEGNNFDTKFGKVRIEQLEMLRDGKMYDMKMTLAD